MTNSSRTLAIVNDTLRTHYWSWVMYELPLAQSSLVPFLLHNLPHISPDSWEERFAFGGVYVNGREALGDLNLPTPCKIEYYEPKFDISQAQSVFPEFKDEYVIYRDEHIIAVYKPPGLSSMPAKEQRHFSVKASVEQLTGTSIHMPSRLDVSAQGIMIMSCSENAHARLQQAFERRQVLKEYRCASTTSCSWSTKCADMPLGRDPLHPVLRRVDHVHGKQALTDFTVLGTSLSGDMLVTVFRALPTTGRTHQIRVHAAACGVPLAGDRFYNGAPAPYLHLVSYAVALQHPITGLELQLTLPQQLRPLWTESNIDTRTAR
jgi:tRNA pseudouridine32 synthase/23S rRNA pseudouridine746 synthase